MVAFPHCKINLGLNVVARRDDGYHDIVTCFYPVAWHDVLEVVPAESLSFHLHGRHIPGNVDDNLSVRAWNLLHDTRGIDPVEIHLLKHIPTGAGLGGGSSDGAFTLRLLNDLFDLGLTPTELAGYAARLGSDCTFFIQDGPMIGRGRGEQLEAVDLSLKGKRLVIIIPDIHISTAEAFAEVIPASPVRDIRTIVEQHPLSSWKALLKNDFEEHIFKSFPTIGGVYRKLYDLGAEFAGMSGTGSAVYGIFDHEVVPDKELPGHTCWFGTLG